MYFGGKLVQSNGAVVVTDRLGSVRASSNGDRMTYYPYGEERTSTADGREKFGTYMRDSVSQDYADQRYYAVGMGRFNTPDPYRASGGPADPASWNRYAYTRGDPVNRYDPAGLADFSVTGYCYGCSVTPTGSSIGSTQVTGGRMSNLAVDLGEIGGDDGGADGIGPLQDRDLLPDALKQALQDLLKPGCAKAVFGRGIEKGHDPAAVLQAIADGTKYGSLVFKALPQFAAADEIASGGLFRSKKVTIEINTFNNPKVGTYWNAGDSGVNAITLLHELGHAFNDLFGRGSSSIEYDANKDDGTPNNDAEKRNEDRLAPCRN